MASLYGVRIEAQGMDAFVAEMSKGGAGTDALTNATTRLNTALPGVAAGLSRTQAEAERTSARLRDLSSAKETASAGAGKFSTAVGQAGFQLQDFSVQVAGGTSALTAFGQQAPQLLGIFGPGGAIAGAVVAVGALAAGLLLGKSNAEALKEALKEQGASFKEAAAAAERWRDGLSKEAAQVVDLRGYYASLSQERQGYEVRALERQRDELNKQTEALRSKVERPLGGLVNTAQLDQAAAAAANLPADQRELYLSNPDLQRIRDASDALRAFRDENKITEDTLAALSARLREVAGDSGDAFSRRLRSSADELEKNGPAARELSTNIEQLEARFRGLTGQLGETEAKLRALRNAAIENPMGALNAETANLEQRLQALRTGGLDALERVTRGQEAQTNITQRATAAQEAFAKALQFSGVQAAEAGKLAEEAGPGFVAAATRAEEAGTRLIEAKKKAEEAKRAAEAAARAGRTASRADERDAERFDLTHYDTAVINPASGLLSLGADDDKRQAAIRRNADLVERANDRNREQQRQALEQQERAAERSTDSIVRYGADAFADMTGKNTKGWAGFLEGLESTAKRTFARIAAEAIIRPVVTPLVQGFLGSGSGNLYQGLAQTFGFGQVAGLFGGGGAGVGSLRNGFGGGGSAATIYGTGAAQPRLAIGGGATEAGGGLSLMDAGGGLYKIVNGGGAGTASVVPSGITNFLNTPIYTTEAGAAAGWSGTAIAGVDKGTQAGYGLTYGSALGAGASIAGGAYGIYSGLQRGGAGGYTTAAGGAIGVASGAVAAGVGTGLIGASSTLAMLGPYGMVAAAVLAIIGSLLPGAKPSNRTGSASIDLGTGATDVFGQTGSKFSQENRDSAVSLAQGVKALTDSIGKLTGASVQGTAVVDVGNRDGLGLAISTAQGTRTGYKFAADEAGQAELMRTVASTMIDSMLERMPTAVNRAIAGVSRDSSENILTGLAKIAEATGGGKPTDAQNLASRNIDFGAGLDAGLADLKWAGTTYTSLTAAKGNPLEQQLNELAATWNDNISRAQRLGLATDGLADAFAKAQAEVVKAATDAQRALIDPVLARRETATSGNAFGAQLFLADRGREVELENYRKQLEALGMGGADLAGRLGELSSTQAAERARTIEQRDQTYAGLVGNLSLRGAQARGDANAPLQAFDFNAAVEARSFGDQLRALGASAQQVAEQMEALGQVQSVERANLTKQIEQQANAAKTAAEAQRNSSARGLLEQLAIGNLGGLTGETRYFAGLQSLSTAKRGLSDGTPEAVAEYARVAQLVLPVLRDYLGTSERFGAISADVAGTLARAAPGGDVANLATLIEATSTGTDQLTTTLLSTSGVTNDLLSRIQTDIARLTGQIAAVMARAA